MTLRVGTLGYATDQGLGYLVKSFYDAGVITDVYPMMHRSRTSHFEWYEPSESRPPVLRSNNRVPSSVMNFVRDMDVMVFFETPFWWDLIPYAYKHGKKVILMPMHECMPDPLPHQPSLFINPSSLEQRLYGGMRLPVPPDQLFVDEAYLRKKARKFLHNAGHLGLKGRNGTAELIQAIPHIKSQDIELEIRGQDSGFLDLIRNTTHLWEKDHRVRMVIGEMPREKLYRDYDVFVFPEKFNGLSLPLQEAHANGMVVITTHREPNCEWLPTEPLIPVKKEVPDLVGIRYTKFMSAVVSPEAIASKIDEVAQYSSTNIMELSQTGIDWGKANSWAEVQPKYLDAIHKLMKGT